MSIHCLIRNGSFSKLEFWNITAVSFDTVALCYGSMEEGEIQKARIKDMKVFSIDVSSSSPSAEMSKRLKGKMNEGYEYAPQPIVRAIEEELNRRWYLEESVERIKASGSTPKLKRKNWKPSDNFAWF